MLFSQSRGELEETLRRLQHHKGVTGVIVINSSGIVTKTTMDNTATAKMTSMVRSITSSVNMTILILNSQVPAPGQVSGKGPGPYQ